MACDSQSEKSLLKTLHKLLDAADIVVAHNGSSFDIKKINARLIVHNFRPPSPYRIVDTKLEAKRIAAFDSNKLENLSIDMDEGNKIKHRGFDMWEGCMAGKVRDWRDMKRYNKGDVVQLRRIFLRLRPWIKSYPMEYDACRCGETRAQKHGMTHTRTVSYVRLQCNNCGAWRRGDSVKRRAVPRA